MSKKRGSDGEFGTEDLRRMAMKHASLKQEYNELQRETRAMKKRLQRAKLKKDNLLAEVRFLRKRHRLLTKRGSQFSEGSPSRKQTLLAQAEYAVPLKTPLATQAIPYEYDYATTGTSSDEDGIPQAVRKDSSSSMEFSHSPETKPLVTKEFQVFWEPLRTAASAGREEAPTMSETAKKKPPPPLVESDLNLSIFKDVPNGFLLPNRTGKRKISWQDQMALKV
uniref:Uncharacterized protein n=1 Tax=Picea sitchensis TaxID=3332 RepID=A9NR01_PICSI|nr:unknown [Picea sitchensis]